MRTIFYLLAVGFAATTTTHANANLVTYRFEGTVTSAMSANGVFTKGASIVGHLSFDPSTSLSPSQFDPASFFSSSPTGFSNITVNGVAYLFPPVSYFTIVGVYDNAVRVGPMQM